MNKINTAIVSALNLLSKRDATEKEIREKLISESYSNEDVEATIKRLYELDMIKEGDVAETINRSNKTKGKKYIKNIMIKKGINPDMIEESLPTEDEEIQKAKMVAENKVRHIKAKTPYEKEVKLAQFLYGRGFESNVAIKISKEICKQYFSPEQDEE